MTYKPNDPNSVLAAALETVYDIDRHDSTVAGRANLAFTLAGLVTNLSDLASEGQLPDEWNERRTA